MRSLEGEPRRNILRKAAGIVIPPTILVSQVACSAVYDISIPPCDTDPQPKIKTVTLANFITPQRVAIEEIIMTATRNAGEVDIDQRKQPEEHRIKIFPDGHMEFRGTNGRTYSISKEPGLKPTVTKLTIQADCKTPTPK